MRPQRIVNALLLAVPVTASTTYEGYGTVYTLSSPSDGNCNFMSWPDAAVTKYAALNAEQWEETMNCGRCAQVTCTDASCAGQASEIVYIMDQCPGCAYGDLDLSPDVFESITGQSYTKLSIEWQFVDCPISNNVQYCLKTGSSEFWVAVQPTNFVLGVQSLSINGQETSVIDSAYYFLIDGSGESVADLSSVSISLTGVNGEVLEETLSLSADECTNGNSQFSSSGDNSQTRTTTQTSTTSAPTPTSPTPTSPTPTTPTPTTPTPTSPTPTTPTPTTPTPTTAPETEAPTTTFVTEAPTIAPASDAPTTAPVTEAPTTAPVTTAPATEAPTTAPVTEVPTSQPTTASPTPTPAQKLSAAQSASSSSDAALATPSSSTDQEMVDQTTSTQTAAMSSTNSTSSSDVERESESASAANEEQRATKVSSSAETSTTVQSETSTPAPSSTPSATVASVQEEASSSGGLHSTAAIVGLIAAACVALGAAVGVAMAVHRKRKLLEASKSAEDRDSMASYVSVRTPRSEVPVMHSAV